MASLSGVAFSWYGGLPPNSIHSWQEMVEAFHRRFSSVSRSVSYSELLATKQTKGEPFDATLARWLRWKLQCEKELDEPEVQMCIDNRLFDRQICFAYDPSFLFRHAIFVGKRVVPSERWQSAMLIKQPGILAASVFRARVVALKSRQPSLTHTHPRSRRKRNPTKRSRRRIFLQLRPRLDEALLDRL